MPHPFFLCETRCHVVLAGFKCDKTRGDFELLISAPSPVYVALKLARAPSMLSQPHTH